MSERILMAGIALGCSLCFGAEQWALEKAPDQIHLGRKLEVFTNGVREAWGYAAPQKDAFLVLHPKQLRENAPLYVVLHSAGHDVYSCLKCTLTPGNHDIYHAPEDFFALYFYWCPFGHANNNEKILAVNDLAHSFDWLNVRKNEAYRVFTDASTNDPLPWPSHLDDKRSEQVNAFFRWKTLTDMRKKVEISLFLVTPDVLKTAFAIPSEATATVSLRRCRRSA